jgi:hypothetical protein
MNFDLIWVSSIDMPKIFAYLRRDCELKPQLMKQFSLLIIITNFSIHSFSQTTFKKNSIYLEAGGNGLFGSVNYERQLTKEPGLGARLGVGFYTEKAFYLTIPVGINYLFELKREGSFIDAGLGVTFVRIDGELFGDSKNPNGDHFVNFIPSIGYRRHTARNVMFRASLTPVFNEDAFVPWIGLSIGKQF